MMKINVTTTMAMHEITVMVKSSSSGSVSISSKLDSAVGWYVDVGKLVLETSVIFFGIVVSHPEMKKYTMHFDCSQVKVNSG